MNRKENTYYIGQLAKELGLSQRTIRYYEELGFINPRRTEGGFRTYSGRDADILRMVIRFKDLGMRLDDIRSLLLTSETTLTSKVMTQLVEALQTRRCDFESKMKECTESIEQIDKVRTFLSIGTLPLSPPLLSFLWATTGKGKNETMGKRYFRYTGCLTKYCR